jgi:aryl-alcohol dehydrogenase-like predicted oxidoreductase
MRDPAGAFMGFDSRPPRSRTFVAYSLKRLGVDYIDIYRPARLDPKRADRGHRRRHRRPGQGRLCAPYRPVRSRRRDHPPCPKVHPITDLQIEYSLISRGIEDDILPTCRELGIGITAYGVLSRGLISGHWTKGAGKAGRDFRAMSPRFQGENLDANLALVEALRAVAEAKGVTTAQAAIAWVAAQGPDIIPLIGARRRDRLAEALGALEVSLSTEDLAAIEAAVPKDAVAGTRYAEAMMAHLDSER